MGVLNSTNYQGCQLQLLKSLRCHGTLGINANASPVRHSLLPTKTISGFVIYVTPTYLVIDMIYY